MAVPSDFAGLLAWHEGAGQPEADGVASPKLIGLYGTADGQVQATGLRQPVMATIAGARALQFDAADDTLKLAAGSSVTSGDFTIFLKYAPRSSSTGRRTLDGTSGNWLVGVRGESGGTKYLHYNGSFLGTVTAAAGDIRVHTIKHSALTNRTTYYIDGVPVGTNTPSNLPGVLQIGNGGGEPADADVYAVGVYNAELAEADQQAIETYLGVAFPPNPTIRLTQEAVEVVHGGTAHIQATQLALEAVHGGTPNILLSQHVIEAVHGAVAHIQISQFVIELVLKRRRPGRVRVQLVG